MKRHHNDGVRKVCDCPRRAWAKCSHPWHFNYKWKGTGYRFSLDKELGRRVKDKTEARSEANRIRTAIQDGKFRRTTEPAVVESASDLTFDVVGGKFLDGYVKSPLPRKRRKGENGGKASWENDAGILRILSTWLPNGKGPRIGSLPIAAVTEDVVEAVVQELRARNMAASTVNKYVQLFRVLSRWTVKKGYRTAPFVSVDSEIVCRDQHARRNRRLRHDEEVALLRHARPHLQALIVAALETACRKGELLSLQWQDVDLKRKSLTLTAAKTKTKKDREIPITAKLQAVLEMRKTDPAGQDHKPTAYVFGDEIGAQVGDVKKGWEATLRRAGITDLTFHDLRHEAASRWADAGVPLHRISEWLGHSDLKTTSIYVNHDAAASRADMERFEKQRLQSVAIETTMERPPAGNEAAHASGKSLVN